MQQTSEELIDCAHSERSHTNQKHLQRWLRPGLTIVITIFLSSLVSYTILYFTLPKPVLTIQSDYHHNGLSVGSSGTLFYLNGRNFDPNVDIMLYLDGKQLTNPPSIKSTQDGTFRAELKVTANWTPGKHQISAWHATTRLDSAELLVVQPGEAHTPGPANAPPNDSSFELVLTFHGYVEHTTPFTWQQEFDVRGKDNLRGGSVCTDADNGKPQRVSATQEETHFRTTRCQGSYQRGLFIYDQIIIADQMARHSGHETVYCSLPSGSIYLHIQGAFSNKTVATGIFEFQPIKGTCTSTQHYMTAHITGTWIGHFPDDD